MSSGIQAGIHTAKHSDVNKEYFYITVMHKLEALTRFDLFSYGLLLGDRIDAFKF